MTSHEQQLKHPIQDPSQRLLKPEEAALYLNVSPRFIRRLREERRLPFQKVGKFLRIRVADLERFIELESQSDGEEGA